MHFHGFPNAAPVFDGMPEGSFGINMGASLTYFYNIVEPGTFIYHCHVEATEHMQMGMLGQSLRDARRRTARHAIRRRDLHQVRLQRRRRLHRLRRGLPDPARLGFDPNFHDASEAVQPLPFAVMKDTYAMLNGRGYPDTVNPAALPTPTVERRLSVNNDNQSQKDQLR